MSRLLLCLCLFLSPIGLLSNEVQTPIFYIDRGEDFLAEGLFDRAISELMTGYELNLEFQRPELEFRALFALMLAYLCADQEKEAVAIADYLHDFLEQWDCESCQNIQLCSGEGFVVGPDKEPYAGWCEETVKSTSAVLKGIVRGSPLKLAARESIIFTIDKFQEQALICCARGGLWKACVGPLAQKLYEWKILDIPPDPMWD
jgi:hypothetical protein